MSRYKLTIINKHHTNLSYRLQRMEFVYKHKDLMSKAVIEIDKHYPLMMGLLNTARVVELARDELRYSPKTSTCDIASTLRHLYKDMIKAGAIVTH